MRGRNGGDVFRAVRAMYPDAVSSREVRHPAGSAEGRYCVGGGLLKYLGIHTNGFPSSEQIATGLRQVNPALSDADAVASAGLIIHANDGGEIERAWMRLRDALLYREVAVVGSAMVAM